MSILVVLYKECHVQMHIFSPIVIRRLLFILLSCMYLNYVHRFMYVNTCQLYFTMTNIWVTKFRGNLWLNPKFRFKKGQAVVSKIIGLNYWLDSNLKVHFTTLVPV